MSLSVRAVCAFLLIVLWAAPDRVAATHGDPDPVRAWNELALQTVRTLRLSDAQAARLYAMVNVAMFDAVNGILTRGGRPGAGVTRSCRPPGRRRTATRRRGSRRGACSPRRRAPVAGRRLRRATRGRSGVRPRRPGRARLGRQVGAAVRALRTADGSTPNESQAGSDAPGQFPRLVVGRAVPRIEAVRDRQRVSLRGFGPAGTRQPSVRQRLRGGEGTGQAAIPDETALATYTFWSLGRAPRSHPAHGSSGARGDRAVAAAAAGDDAAVRPARHGAERHRRAHGDDEVRVSLLASGDGDPAKLTPTATRTPNRTRRGRPEPAASARPRNTGRATARSALLVQRRSPRSTAPTMFRSS